MKRAGILAVCLLLGLAAFSQNRRGDDGEKIEQLRIAHLTDELDLTREEGQVFWPVYNEYQDERSEIEEKIKIAAKTLRKQENPSEKDVATTIAEIADMKIRLIELESQFFQVCLPILGTDRTILLINSERSFKKKLADKIGDRRQPNSGGPARK